MKTFGWSKVESVHNFPYCVAALDFPHPSEDQVDDLKEWCHKNAGQRYHKWNCGYLIGHKYLDNTGHTSDGPLWFGFQEKRDIISFCILFSTTELIQSI